MVPPGNPPPEKTPLIHQAEAHHAGVAANLNTCLDPLPEPLLVAPKVQAVLRTACWQREASACRDPVGSPIWCPEEKRTQPRFHVLTQAMLPKWRSQRGVRPSAATPFRRGSRCATRVQRASSGGRCRCAGSARWCLPRIEEEYLCRTNILLEGKQFEGLPHALTQS